MQRNLNDLLTKTTQDNATASADQKAAVDADAKAAASAAVAAADNGQVNTVLLSSAVPMGMVQDPSGLVWQGVSNASAPNTFRIPASTSVNFDDGVADPNQPAPTPTPTPTPTPPTDTGAPPTPDPNQPAPTPTPAATT